MRTVLFAGGPLHGETMVTGSHVVYATVPEETSLALPDPYAAPFRQVAYSVSRFAMCGHIVWIGHLGTTPDEDLVFEVLTSDGAKAASDTWHPAAHP